MKVDPSTIWRFLGGVIENIVLLVVWNLASESGLTWSPTSAVRITAFAVLIQLFGSGLRAIWNLFQKMKKQ